MTTQNHLMVKHPFTHVCKGVDPVTRLRRHTCNRRYHIQYMCTHSYCAIGWLCEVGVVNPGRSSEEHWEKTSVRSRQTCEDTLTGHDSWKEVEERQESAGKVCKDEERLQEQGQSQSHTGPS